MFGGRPSRSISVLRTPLSTREISPKSNHSHTYASFARKSIYSRTYAKPGGGGYKLFAKRTKQEDRGPSTYYYCCTYSKYVGAPTISFWNQALQPAWGLLPHESRNTSHQSRITGHDNWERPGRRARTWREGLKRDMMAE